jgi:hypothetical protein
MKRLSYNQIYEIIKWFDPNDLGDRQDVIRVLKELAPFTTVGKIKKLWLQLCKEYEYGHYHRNFSNNDFDTCDSSSLPIPPGANIDY